VIGGATHFELERSYLVVALFRAIVLLVTGVVDVFRSKTVLEHEHFLDQSDGVGRERGVGGTSVNEDRQDGPISGI
jgi:hypothetical protein